MIEPNLKRQLDYMERELTTSEWFAGDEFSAADIQMSFPVEAAAQRAGLDASRPKLMAFLKKIHARPAYRRGARARRPLQLRQRLRPRFSAASVVAATGSKRAAWRVGRDRRGGRLAPTRRASAVARSRHGAPSAARARAASGSSSARRSAITVRARIRRAAAAPGLAPRAIRKHDHVALRCPDAARKPGRPARAAAAPRPARRARRRQVGELRQLVEPPVDRGPVARCAAPPRSRSAGRRRSRRARRSGRCPAISSSRPKRDHEQRRDRAAPSGLNESLPGSSSPRSSQLDEHPVEADRAGARAAEHAEDVVADGARVVLGEAAIASRTSGDAAPEVGAGVGRGQRPAAASGRSASTLRALVDQLGQGTPEPRVAGGDGERAFLQARAGRCRRVRMLPGDVVAARVERALHAVELDARRRIVRGELAVDVLDHVPGDAGVGGDAGGGDEQPDRRAAGQQRRRARRRRAGGEAKKAARTVELGGVRGATMGRTAHRERRRKTILSTPRARVREHCPERVALCVTPCAVRFRACIRPRRGGVGRGRIQSARRRTRQVLRRETMSFESLGRHAGAFVLSLLLAVGGTARRCARPLRSAPVAAKNGMVVTAQHLATEVGVDVLKQGGNAVDAAVAVGYALAVVYPAAGNLGGGGFMTHSARRRPQDLPRLPREGAARRDRRHVPRRRRQRRSKGSSTSGHLAVGVPGTVSGLETGAREVRHDEARRR